MGGRKPRKLQQCAALLGDNITRCTRWALKDANYCHVHSINYVPQGAAARGRKPKLMTEVERLEHWIDTQPPDIAMKAMERLSRLRGATSNPNTMTVSVPKKDAFLAAMTPEQRAEMQELRERFKALQVEVYLAHPHLKPENFRMPGDSSNGQ